MSASAAHPPVGVVDPAHPVRRIDHAEPGGERALPYFCPYCADEDLRPHGPAPGAWHCRACLRAFRLAFLGMEDPR